MSDQAFTAAVCSCTDDAHLYVHWMSQLHGVMQLLHCVMQLLYFVMLTLALMGN